jgi:hypothetical protein
MTLWFAILLFGLAGSLAPAAPCNATTAERGPAAWPSIASTVPWNAPAMGELALPTATAGRRRHAVPSTEIRNRVFTRPVPRDPAPPLSPSDQLCRARALLCRPHDSVSARYPTRILDGAVAAPARLPREPHCLETDPIC